jgi:hypothetical protein
VAFPRQIPGKTGFVNFPFFSGSNPLMNARPTQLHRPEDAGASFPEMGIGKKWVSG